MNNVEKLILGRRELDRKKEEIVEITGVLLRHISLHDRLLEFKHRESTIVFRQDCDFEWQLIFRGERNEILLSYEYIGYRSFYRSFYTRNMVKVIYEPPVGEIDHVHKSLETLVKAVVERFPEMDRALLPYFLAAEAAT